MKNTNSVPKRYLFYIEQNYSFEILRPLQEAIRARGDEVRWFGTGKELSFSSFTNNDIRIEDIEDVINYNPQACFVPGNLIPNFIPGIKVQVFHGLEWKKKGHFVIRNCFDLYCPHGPATTKTFDELAKSHDFFDVVETGWPKLDNLFTTKSHSYFANENTCILYAPTFSPALTSAPALLSEITKLMNNKPYNWLIKFHPKMNKDWMAQYKPLESDNVKIIDSGNLNQLLQSADLMISDTSSVIGEFSLLNKPVITLNNSSPGDYLINIDNPALLSEAINTALSPSAELRHAIEKYASELHPYQDGQSSNRILDAVERILTFGKNNDKNLPINLFRNLKVRKRLKYWKF
jgi:hypothetical protein